MTNDELLALKDLSQNCHVFEPFETTLMTDEMAQHLARNNGEFFVRCVKCIPDLVDELIELRELERMYQNYELC